MDMKSLNTEKNVIWWGSRVLVISRVKSNFVLKVLNTLNAFGPTFDEQIAKHRLDWVRLLKLIKKSGNFLEALVYEDSYSWKKSDNFYRMVF